MAVNYRVAARIINIQRQNPISTDRILVDTNVLFWYTYYQGTVGLSPYRLDQIQMYLDFMNKAIAAKTALFYSELSFAELAYNIEQSERDLAGFTDRQSKEFRHNYPAERQKVVKEITTAWQQVKSVSSSLPQPTIIDAPLVDDALQKLQTQKLDGYDYFLVETARKNGISQILTDDGDFSSVPGITVLTNNQRVIDFARQQGRLQTSR